MRTILSAAFDHSSGRKSRELIYDCALSQPERFTTRWLPDHCQTETYVTTDKDTEAPKSHFKEHAYQHLLSAAWESNRISHRYQRCLYALQRIWCLLSIRSKAFLMPLKSTARWHCLWQRNVKQVPFSRHARSQGKHCAPNLSRRVDFPLHLLKEVFVNEDHSTGVLYLVASDTTLTAERITTPIEHDACRRVSQS